MYSCKKYLHHDMGIVCHCFRIGPLFAPIVLALASMECNSTSSVARFRTQELLLSRLHDGFQAQDVLCTGASMVRNYAYQWTYNHGWWELIVVTVAALTWLQRLDMFKSFNESCWLCAVARWEFWTAGVSLDIASFCAKYWSRSMHTRRTHSDNHRAARTLRFH